MKILGIVAGRHNGNSEILVKEALLARREAGAECKLINLFDYNIEHCTGCEACTMQMGDVAMGKLDKYNGCILKAKMIWTRSFRNVHLQRNHCWCSDL